MHLFKRVITVCLCSTIRAPPCIRRPTIYISMYVTISPTYSLYTAPAEQTGYTCKYAIY